MEHERLSTGAIREILHRAKEEQFSKASPATRHFFEHEPPSGDQQDTLTVHSWAFAKLESTDSRKVVRHLATSVVKEVVAKASTITGEIVFRLPNLLPHLPCWNDGASLFATHSAESGSDRFGVVGGNVIWSGDSLSEDVYSASERLVELDPSYERDEKLQLFCAKPMEKKLIRACAKAGVACRVFGIRNFRNQRSWVLTRDASACSLLIGRPTFDIPVKENHLVVGARFVVWINNPRFAVCTVPGSPK